MSSTAVARDQYSSEYSFRESEDRYPAFPGGKDIYFRILKDGDLAGEVDAKRKLNAEDQRFLTELAAFAIDKRYWYNTRRSALKDLGRMAHSHAIPALVAVVRDEKELHSVREQAAFALTMIRDPRAVDHLIEDGLTTGVPVFGYDVITQLRQMVGGFPPNLADSTFNGGVKWPPEDEEELDDYLQTWKKWWAKHRDTVKFNTTDRTAH